LVKCSLIEELDSLIREKIGLLQKWNRPTKDEIDIHKKHD
jgi:hypothetical protein